MDPTTAQGIVRFAEEMVPKWKGLDGRDAIASLEARRPAALEAMQALLGAGAADEALRLCIALSGFWTATGRMDEARDVFSRALAFAGGDASLRGRALFETGMMAFWSGHDERAAGHFEEAHELGRGNGDDTLAALGLGGLARLALRTDLAEARQLCRRAIALTSKRRCDGYSGAVHVLAVAAQMEGKLHEARILMLDRIALARETGNYRLVSAECGNLSMVERQLGRLDEAESRAREGLEIDVRRGDDWSLPYKLAAIAAVRAERGLHAQAARLVGAAEAMVESQRVAWPPDDKVHYEALKQRLAQAMGEAAFLAARDEGRALPVPEAVQAARGP